MSAPSCGLWVQSLSALAFASSAAPDCSQLCFSKSVGLRLASSTNAPSRRAGEVRGLPVFLSSSPASPIRPAAFIIFRVRSLQRYRIGQADEAIAKLNKENQNIARAYHAEQERRENSLFGLGAIGAMLKKENTTQQQMQDAYNIRHREKQKLEQGREQMQAEYSEKLEREADKYQEVYRQISAKLAEEITRRPLEAFRVPYEQAKQSSTTLAATRSAERIEKELSAKKADPIGQRIAYITGAAELVRVEKIAKPHEERQQARKTQGKGGIER